MYIYTYIHVRRGQRGLVSAVQRRANQTDNTEPTSNTPVLCVPLATQCGKRMFASV